MSDAPTPEGTTGPASTNGKGIHTGDTAKDAATPSTAAGADPGQPQDLEPLIPTPAPAGDTDAGKKSHGVMSAVGGAISKVGGAISSVTGLSSPSRGADDCLSSDQMQQMRNRIRQAESVTDDVAEELSAALGMGNKLRSRNIYIPNAAERLNFVIDCLLAKKPQLILARDERLRLQIEVYRKSGMISRTLARISSGSSAGLVLAALMASIVLWTITVFGVRALVDSKFSTVADIFFMDGKALAVIASAAFIGGVVSIATRLQEFSRVRDLDPFAMFWTALLKPLIGVVLSLFILATLASGLITFILFDDNALVKLANAADTSDKSRTLYALWVIGFLAGFSERFAWDFVNRAQGAANGNLVGDKKTEAKKG